MIWLGQVNKMPASLNVLCGLFINFVLLSTMVPVIQTVLWENHLESNPHLYNANNNGITMTEGNMSTYVTLQTPTTNSTSTWQTIASQSIEDAKKAFIATQGVKISSIFICKMAVQVVTGLFVGPFINMTGYKVSMFAGAVVMMLSAIGFALAKSYPALFVSVAIQGIGASCNVVGGMTMLASTVTDKNIRGHVIRLSLLSILLGAAAGLWSGEFVETFYDKTVHFLILAGVIALHGFFLMCLYFLKIERNEEAKQPETMLLLLDCYTSTALFTLVLLGLVLGTITDACSGWSISGRDLSSWQTVLAIFFILCGPGLVIATNFISRPTYSGWRWMGIISGFFIIIVPLISFPLSLRIATTNASIIAISFGIALVATNIYPNLAYVAEENYDSNYAAIYALVDVALNVGFIAGVLVTSGIMPVICIYPVLMLIIPYAYLLYVKCVYGPKAATINA